MKTGILPYPDTKEIGAADFYFGINATFRFIHARFGMPGLEAYWQDMARDYFRPVTERWTSGGLDAVAEYWRAFFAAEPGSDVHVRRDEGKVTVEVRQCPAITHLRRNGRKIVPEFCQHCYFVSDAIAEGAGLAARVCGGDGSCVQQFVLRSDAPPQDIRQIASCS